MSTNGGHIEKLCAFWQTANRRKQSLFNFLNHAILTTHTANGIADLVVYITLANDNRRELCTAIADRAKQVIGATVRAADSGE
jgi:hypothetical protein